jgi:hypothetical protein
VCRIDFEDDRVFSVIGNRKLIYGTTTLLQARAAGLRNIAVGGAEGRRELNRIRSERFASGWYA